MEKTNYNFGIGLGKTTLDEKAVEVYDEVKDRAGKMANEFKDVIDASKG